MLCATQGIEKRLPLLTSKKLQNVILHLRRNIPRLENDRYMATDIEAGSNMIQDKEILLATDFDLSDSNLLN